jgi:hypothetical protein
MQIDDCEEGLLKAQDTAAELYQLAALMLGNENEALNLVESTVARVEVDPCAEEDAAVDAARHQLIEAAVARMNQADPGAFATPAPADGPASCIEDDDLSAAGISPSQMAELIGGAGSPQLRAWLDQLPAAQRAIFVQRAVLGWDNCATAASLANGAGAKPGWSAAQVGELFRQALCSLANSLVHNSLVHAGAQRVAV